MLEVDGCWPCSQEIRETLFVIISNKQLKRVLYLFFSESGGKKDQEDSCCSS